MNTTVTVMIGDEPFAARWEEGLAPETCARVRALLPWSERMIHVCWSGEACWVPLGALDLGVGPESATSYPLPGQLLFHPAGRSEAEILLAYGSVSFGSKVGRLAGNPFLTITEKLDRLAEIGREILWEGAREVTILETAVAGVVSETPGASRR